MKDEKTKCKNHNKIDDYRVDVVKKKGKWSKLRRNISNVFEKNKAGKHSTMVKSQSLKEILKIEENAEKKPEVSVSKTMSVSVNGIKMRRMRSVKIKHREGRPETEEGNQELCKKRILMGGKCRPLNVTGVLHYDGNGILLPEDVP